MVLIIVTLLLSQCGWAEEYVLESEVERYRKLYSGTVLPLDATGIDATTNLPSMTRETFDLQGRRIDKAQKGINIIRNADGTTKKVLTKHRQTSSTILAKSICIISRCFSFSCCCLKCLFYCFFALFCIIFKP
ncbi:MAG: hypothetical protein IKT83_01725 [Bacteroidaceae bacterium]|nr:hypothetical protein [Bacteroidaceae bacterium]